MGVIQNSINQVLGLTALATTTAVRSKEAKIKETQEVQSGLKDVDVQSKKAKLQYMQASEGYNKYSQAGKGYREKATGRFAKFHDVEKARTSLELAQANIDAISFQRQLLQERLQKLGGNK